MQIAVGIGLIITCVLLFIPSGNLLMNTIAMLLGVACIVALFNISVPIWMTTLAIVGTASCAVGAFLNVALGLNIGYFMVIGGIICNVVVGINCFF